MTIKSADPKQLAQSLLKRSICAIQVAAVIYDNEGIHGWGWNHMGPDGMGEHAEVMAIGRANPERLWKSTIVVVAQKRANHGKIKLIPSLITAKPCPVCQMLIDFRQIMRVVYRNGEGEWQHEQR